MGFALLLWELKHVLLLAFAAVLVAVALLAITRAVADAVPVPVIASGGAGVAQHLVDGIVQGRADAVLVAGILHDGVTTVQALKQVMREAGLPVRLTSTGIAA